MEEEAELKSPFSARPTWRSRLEKMAETFSECVWVIWKRKSKAAA